MKARTIEISVSRIDFLFFYIIAAAVILNCNSVYEISGLVSEKIIYIVLVTAIACFILLHQKDIFRADSIKKWMLILGIGIYQMLHMIARDGFQKWFIIKFVLILMGIMIVFLTDILRPRDGFKEILRAVSNIMVVLAVISLIFWTVGSVANILPATGEIEMTWGSSKIVKSYIGLHFNAQNIVLYGVDFYRNTGIFAEAPMYAFLLSLALMYEIFISEKIRKMRIGILLITILTTVSATGIIAAGGTVLLGLMQQARKNKILLWIICGICAIFICVAFGYKVTRTSSNSSFNIRIQDYKIIMQSLADRPLLGYGYEQYNEIVYRYMDLGRGYDTGGSNGFFYPITQGGLLMFFPYLVSYVLLLMSCIKRKSWKEICFWGMYFLLFSTSIISLKLISIVVIAAGVTVKWRKEKLSVGREIDDQYSCLSARDMET